jgi:hypothetical protein
VLPPPPSAGGVALIQALNLLQSRDLDRFEAADRTHLVIEALERDLGLPVLTSNQCLLWALLQDAGVRQPLGGLGALLCR